ncbi:hypothetical protein ACET3Z_032541 [Daucus carota]
MGINKSTPADEISDEDDDFVTPAKQFGKTKNVSMNRQGEKRTYETNACRCTERRNKVTKKKDRETEDTKKGRMDDGFGNGSRTSSLNKFGDKLCRTTRKAC